MCSERPRSDVMRSTALREMSLFKTRTSSSNSIDINSSFPETPTQALHVERVAEELGDADAAPHFLFLFLVERSTRAHVLRKPARL